MNEKKIIVACKGHDLISIDEIEAFQGNLKRITKQNLEKLKSRIKKSFDVPFFIWERPDGVRKILDGHSRRKALIELREEGWEIPPLPYDLIEAENEKDARQKLLGITSQYGEFEIEELSEWMKDFNEENEIDFRLVNGKEIEFVKIKDEDIKNIKENLKESEIKEYKKVHVLLSMNQDIFFENQNIFKQLKKIEGLEYEQSQN